MFGNNMLNVTIVSVLLEPKSLCPSQGHVDYIPHTNENIRYLSFSD